MRVDSVCVTVIPAAGVFAGRVTELQPLPCPGHCAGVKERSRFPVAGAVAAACLEGMQASCPHPAAARLAVSTLYGPLSERLASLAYRWPMLPPTQTPPHLSIFNLLLALSVDCSLVIRHESMMPAVHCVQTSQPST